MIKIGEQIATFRKKKGLTQENVANALGVTNQAVSKWESGTCCPDIELLPEIAKLFGCSIDALFGLEGAFAEGGNVYEHCSQFPWPDDDTVRGVVCLGRKILKKKDPLLRDFTFIYQGNAKDVKSHCSLTVEGNVEKEAKAGGSMSVSGDVGGNCAAGGSVRVAGSIGGNASAGGNVTCSGNVGGSVSAGGSVSCGNITSAGKVQASHITASGDLSAEHVRGTKISCRALKCDSAAGTVKIKN